MFKKWYTACFKTYADVFIRLAAIYFALYLINLLTKNPDAFTINGKPLGIAETLFVILGILMFAKQFPDLLKDLLGIDLKGNFTLNPVKKIEDNALFGKNLTGAAAGLAVGTVGMFTGAGIGRGLTGTLGGLFGGKGIAETLKNQRDKNAAMRTARLDGSTFGGRLHSRFSNALGSGGVDARLEREKHQVQDELDQIDKEIKIVDDKKNAIKGSEAYRNRQRDLEKQKAISDYAGKAKERAISQIQEGVGAAGEKYQDLLQQSEMARSQGDGEAAEYLRQQAEQYKNNDGWKEFISEAHANKKLDAALNGYLAHLDNAYEYAYGTKVKASSDPKDAGYAYGAGVASALGDAKRQINEIEIKGSADERTLAEYDRKIAEHNERKVIPNDRMRDINRREAVAKANQNAIK